MVAIDDRPLCNINNLVTVNFQLLLVQFLESSKKEVLQMPILSLVEGRVDAKILQTGLLICICEVFFLSFFHQWVLATYVGIVRKPDAYWPLAVIKLTWKRVTITSCQGTGSFAVKFIRKRAFKVANPSLQTVYRVTIVHQCDRQIDDLATCVSHNGRQY